MFQQLEPPRGGLALLRERVGRDKRRRRLWRGLATAVVTCAAIFVWTEPLRAPTLEEALAQATPRAPDSTLHLVAQHNGVAFYWAATK